MEMEIEEEFGPDTYLSIFAMAMGIVLQPDEGVIVLFDDKAFVVYRESASGDVAIVHNDAYLKEEHGTLIWMHYPGSLAPAPKDGEEIILTDDIAVDEKSIN